MDLIAETLGISLVLQDQRFRLVMEYEVFMFTEESQGTSRRVNQLSLIVGAAVGSTQTRKRTVCMARHLGRELSGYHFS